MVSTFHCPKLDKFITCKKSRSSAYDRQVVFVVFLSVVAVTELLKYFSALRQDSPLVFNLCRSVCVLIHCVLVYFNTT